MLEMLKERKAALEARGKKGFTLMEMLIVIAIIAVLVAIAIPVLGAQLDRAKATTDEANIRDGYAAMQVLILQPYKADGTKMTSAELNTSWYLQKDGTVAASGDSNYTCEGNSSAIGDGIEVGGLTVYAGATGTTAGWSTGNNIVFVVSDNKISRVYSVAP